MDKDKILKLVEAKLKSADQVFVKQDIKWKGMSDSEKSEIKGALELALKRQQVGNRALVKKMLAFLGSKMEDEVEEKVPTK